MMRLALGNNLLEEFGVNVYGQMINNPRFADIDLIATHHRCIQLVRFLKIDPQNKDNGNE